MTKKAGDSMPPAIPIASPGRRASLPRRRCPWRCGYRRPDPPRAGPALAPVRAQGACCAVHDGPRLPSRAAASCLAIASCARLVGIQRVDRRDGVESRGRMIGGVDADGGRRGRREALSGRNPRPRQARNSVGRTIVQTSHAKIDAQKNGPPKRAVVICRVATRERRAAAISSGTACFRRSTRGCRRCRARWSGC